MSDLRPMRTIAIDIRLIGKGRTGDEVVFANLTREVIRADREHRYFLLTDERTPQVLAAIAQTLGTLGRENVAIVSLPARNRYLWNGLVLPLWLLWHRPDTFHTQYILPFFLLRSLRVVLHIHDVSFVALPDLIRPLDRFFLGLLIPRALRRADAIVVPSRFTKSEVMKYFSVPAEKITVVPNAASVDYGKEPSTESIATVRRRYGLPEPYLIAVGTLQPRKNIPFLIEAFAEARKRLPDLSLVLVGNRGAHNFDREVDATIARLGVSDRVYFPGFVRQADLPAVIAGARGYVFPSRYEGFGIPLLEAMATGVPVACSDIAVFHEVAADVALYFDPRDVASAAETLYNLAIAFPDREGYRMRARARARLFSWAESAALLRDIYIH